MRPFTGCFLLLFLVLPAAATGQTLPADSVLTLARQWLGPAALERIRAMRAVAAVEGPGTALQTVVHSRLGGLIRFEQHAADGPRFIAGIGRGGGWSWSVARGRAEALGREGASTIVGHDWHLLTAYPENWWKAFGPARLELADGDTVWRVEFRDQLGAPATIRYARDGRPVDLLLVNHSGMGSPEVRVRVFDWPQGDSLRLFRHAVILHGSETWLYHYLQLEPDRAGVEAFEPSAPIDGPVRREREEGCP